MGDGSRPSLVLDAGGVLLTEPIPELLYALSEHGTQPLADVTRYFDGQLHDDLWAGRLAADAFWIRLLDYCGLERSQADRWERFFVSRLAPNVDRDTLQSWHDSVDAILVLSNHLTPWLLPALERARLLDLISEVYVSDVSGFVKPDVRAFEPVLNHLDDPSAALYVDDRAPNVATSRRLGIPAIIADAAGSWRKVVDHWTRFDDLP